ncbi:MAG TPA: DUF1801 domain-containing protein [Flavobacteriales bacterium]|nr:DUF1801 domain-containing protein [Flavobacteriales bacterium]
MAELKTTKNKASVKEYISAIENPGRRADCLEVARIMEEITGDKGAMWGASIVGYGSYHYKYASGQEGDWMATGFSSRKQALTLYIMAGFKRYESLMSKLGKYKTGKSCLYIKSLDDIDRNVLKELIRESVDHLTKGKRPDY